MSALDLSNPFIEYLAGMPAGDCDSCDRLPSLSELSKELGISIASLREQMEVARALGLVEVKPRTGIRRLPYTFGPAVRQSLFYALALDRSEFEAYSQLRNHVEASFWEEAVRKLTPGDHATLRQLTEDAWAKLNGTPIQIPQREHRLLHQTVFCRLDNPFVQGLLDAYWEAYDAVGLNVYADYGYLQQVWRFHQEMVDAICVGDFSRGYQALVEHTDLLYHRPERLAK